LLSVPAVVAFLEKVKPDPTIPQARGKVDGQEKVDHQAHHRPDRELAFHVVKPPGHAKGSQRLQKHHEPCVGRPERDQKRYQRDGDASDDVKGQVGLGVVLENLGWACNHLMELVVEPWND
jgi:hypothetical protein